jgi:hypothetical protein
MFHDVKERQSDPIPIVLLSWAARAVVRMVARFKGVGMRRSVGFSLAPRAQRNANGGRRVFA